MSNSGNECSQQNRVGAQSGRYAEGLPGYRVIKQASARYGTPAIVNTDQGSQFTATNFTEAALDAGCKLRMDGRGAWRDNVFFERHWHTVKYQQALHYLGSQ